MLRGKVAVIYGASGGVGTAVAQVFAREGARLFLTGRHLKSVDTIARGIAARSAVQTAMKAQGLLPA
jgi:NADP-dependent 3-hydroxy acid dehydrogenase YdfG